MTQYIISNWGDYMWVSLYYDMVVFHLMLMVPPSVVSGLYAEGCLNHWQLFEFVIVVI